MRNLRRPIGDIARPSVGLCAGFLWAFLLLAGGAAGARTLPDAFFGSWRAAEGALREVTIGREEEGFRAVIGYADGERFELVFTPAERPEVFAAVRSRGLFDLFSLSGPKSPLESGQFDWARLDGDVLYIYRLRIATDGSFVLDRLRIEREGEELVVTLQRRRHARPPIETHIRLAPAG